MSLDSLIAYCEALPGATPIIKIEEPPDVQRGRQVLPLVGAGAGAHFLLEVMR